MDLKKTIGRLSKDAILKQAAKEAVNKILPMEEDKPKFGWKRSEEHTSELQSH